MSKRAGSGAAPSLAKKLRMSNGSAKGGGEIDEDLHSRQLAVYGRESMRKMAATAVLVCGAGGLGVEVAKNVILAGVRAVTIHDSATVALADLGANFYLADADFGKNRAWACANQLQELNTAVAVSASAEDLSEAYLAGFNVVVYTLGDQREAARIDSFCHHHDPPIAFIWSQVAGLFASAFCDFGPSFSVIDTDGEQELSGIVASITPGNPTLVTCVDDQRLGFQDGQLVAFSEVEGMAELNGHAPVRVRSCKPHFFELELDTTGFAPYTKGGIVTQVKEPKELSFRTLAEALAEPGEFLQSDFSKLERSALLHVAFQGLAAFRAQEGRPPAPGSVGDAQKLVALAKDVAKGGVELDEAILADFASGASAELNPMAAVFGGVVGQEVVKAASGKFHPIFQFFYMDALECLPKERVPAEELQPMGCRYDHQIAVFGRGMQKTLSELKVFLVGAGALGCEFLKNFGLMGVACGTSGVCTVTDDDVIERSNLSRQFLFRDWNIGQAKSTTAATAAQKINPELKVKALQTRVSPATEDVFNDDFWMGTDVVVNALDNVNARLYVDMRCVYFGKPLLESGTLGTKCNTQMVVPQLTENYGASRDPPERSAPMCTVHSFPHNIDHCLAWAMSEFEGLLERIPAAVNAFLEDPAKYKEKVQQSSDAAAREQLEKVADALTTDRCTSFDDCMKSARQKFAVYFHDKIAQLVYTFPEDAVTSSNTLFWSAPKRFPHAVEFDAADAQHASLVQAMALLFAEVYGVPKPEWANDAAKVAAEAAKVPIPKFQPKKGVHIETDPNATNTTSFVNTDEGSVIAGLLETLEEAQSALPRGFMLQPIQFEKDDDTNFHMDMIAGLANMRARNYSIPEVDKFKAKITAGRIIPAIATATALATGLVSLELYKVVQKKPIEDYRNTFVNLALPLIAMAEPIPPKVAKFQDMEWSLWDRWILEGDLTVQEVLDWFNERGMKPYSISNEASLLYNNIFVKHKDRLGRKLSELIKTVGKRDIPSWKSYIDVVVACEDDNGEDLDVPLVSIKFR